MNFTEFRLKFRRFFRKYRRILFIIFIIWAIIFFINKIVGNLNNGYSREVTYEPHVGIISSLHEVPNSTQSSIEDIMEEYMTYCNDGEFDKAFEMISEDCRKYVFDNDVEKYMSYLYTKMPTQKVYALQNYSSISYDGKEMYIYDVRYTDDFLATGLTNSTYGYTQEKITFYRGENGLEMNIGDFIYHTDIKNISENEYLKIDIADKIVNYSIESYEMKFTNRSNYTIVISDGQENDEVLLELNHETRKRNDLKDIVIEPGKTVTANLSFKKFVDDNDASNFLVFSSIRVMEKYSGTENIEESVIQSEIDNAIAKFSMKVSTAE